MQNNLNKQLYFVDKLQAINSIKKANSNISIIVDFDETLFLRNSTAEYLDSLRPRRIGLILLKILSVIKPWFWLPKPFKGSQIRDWFLVVIPTILLPWTLFLWRIKAKKLAKEYSNGELIQAFDRNSDLTVVVATLGFNFIVNPILQSMPVSYDLIIGCRFWRGALDRGKGKLLMVREKLPETSIVSAIVITDSYDDLPLLKVVEQPYLIIWPLAKYIPPLKDVYLPFFYLEKVKRVGENYTLKVILWDDIPLLLLAFSWQATHSLWHGISMIFLLISFWCVYELGYYENDYIAEQYEEKPKLSITYHIYQEMMKTGQPWFWSLIFGVAGITLLEKTRGVNLLWDTQFSATNFNYSNSVLLPYLSWAGFLLLLRLCFRIYNYLNKHSRTWLYLVLQSFRYYGFLAVTSTNLVGTSLLSSQIFCRSILYVVYRYSGGNADRWPKQVPEKPLRLLIFVFLLGAIAFGSQSFELWKNWQFLAIVAWCLIQGQGQIIRMLSQVKPVAKDGSNYIKPVSK